MFLGLPQSRANILFVRDAVPPENRTRSVPTYGHGGDFRHMGLDHIFHSTAPEIVDQFRRDQDGNPLAIDDLCYGVPLFIDFRFHKAAGFAGREPSPPWIA